MKVIGTTANVLNSGKKQNLKSRVSVISTVLYGTLKYLHI